MMWHCWSVKMETRWLGNVRSTLMLIVPYSLPSSKSDLSENMALLLRVSYSLVVIWQSVEGRSRVDSYLKGQVTLATEENSLVVAGSQHSASFPSLLAWDFVWTWANQFRCTFPQKDLIVLQAQVHWLSAASTLEMPCALTSFYFQEQRGSAFFFFFVEVWQWWQSPHSFNTMIWEQSSNIEVQ